jgi:hypothetical protein
MAEIDEKDLAEDRRALLKYYSSQSNQHTAYILTLTIAFFAFVQALQYVKLMDIARNAFIAIMLSIFFTLFWYLLQRTFFWGTLSSLACYHRPIPIEDYCERVKYAYSKKIVSITMLQRLNYECIDEYKKDHSFLYHAMNPKICALLWVLASVILYFLLSQLAIL